MLFFIVCLLLMVIAMFYSVYIGDMFWCFFCLLGDRSALPSYVYLINVFECQGPLWS